MEVECIVPVAVMEPLVELLRGAAGNGEQALLSSVQGQLHLQLNQVPKQRHYLKTFEYSITGGA